MGAHSLDHFELRIDLNSDGDYDDANETQLVEDFVDTSNFGVLEPEYDAAGNLTFDGTKAYTYDAFNRLVKVQYAHKAPGSSTIQAGITLGEYAYDAQSRRIRKDTYEGGVLDNVEHFYCIGDTLVETRNGSNQVIQQHVWHSLAPGMYIDSLAEVSNNTNPGVDDSCDQRLFTLQDQQFNVLALTDDAGDIVERYEYTLYGERTVMNASFATLGKSAYNLNNGFQGLYHDAESGLIYNRARMYDPASGRFIQRDPLGYPDGMNTYAAYHVLYGGVDPWGLKNRKSKRPPKPPKPKNHTSTWDYIRMGLEEWFEEAGDNAETWKDTVQDIVFDPGKIGKKIGESIGESCPEEVLDLTGGSEHNEILDEGETQDNIVEAAEWLEWVALPAAIKNILRRGAKEAKDLAEEAAEKSKKNADSCPKDGCFAAGTLVLTEEGLKPIEEVKKGEKVWSYNTETGEWELKTVVEVFVHDYSGDLITLVIKGKAAKASGNHPFWVVSGEGLADRPAAKDVYAHERGMTEKGRWVEARDLRLGDRLLLRSGEAVLVDSISVAQADLRVYNFHVAGLHTYAVGIHGILVHNKADAYDPKKRPLKSPQELVDEAKELNRALDKEADYWRDKIKEGVGDIEKHKENLRRAEQELLDNQEYIWDLEEGLGL